MRLSSEISKFINVFFLNYPTAKCSNAALILLRSCVGQSDSEIVSFHHLLFVIQDPVESGCDPRCRSEVFMRRRILSLERKGQIFRAESYWSLQTTTC